MSAPPSPIVDTPFEALADPHIVAAVERFAGGIAGLHGAIDGRDEMFLYNLERMHGDRASAATLYFAKGWQMVTTLRQLVAHAFGGWSNVRSLLDFASGYGRLTRHLVRELPPERISVADVIGPAVESQRAAFRVDGFVAPADPGRLVLGRRFDSIVVSSLFSHLPPVAFGPWLTALVACLDDDGLLFLSALDLDRTAAAPSDGDSGVVFHPASESRLLPAEQYGTTYVSAPAMRAAIATALPTAAVIRLPAGWCGHQDLYCLAPRGSQRLDRLAAHAPPPFPCGDVTRIEHRGAHSVELAGWAEEPAGGAIESVRLWTPSREQRTEHRADPSSPGRTGWRIEIDLEAHGLDTLTVVAARTAGGAEGPIAIGTLRPFVAP